MILILRLRKGEIVSFVTISPFEFNYNLRMSKRFESGDCKGKKKKLQEYEAKKLSPITAYMHVPTSITQLEAMQHVLYFPRDEIRRKEWTLAVRRADFKVTDSTRICSKHFSEECFDKEKFGGTWLKSDAVPTIFNFPPKVKKMVKKQRSLKRVASSPPTSTDVEDFETSDENIKRYAYIGDFKTSDMYSPAIANKLLEIEKKESKMKDRKIKTLQQREARLSQTILNLEEIIADLRFLVRRYPSGLENSKNPLPVLYRTVLLLHLLDHILLYYVHC
ncbi:hypothetical protein CEXT_699481 [Caerostris extrusa]|uniref:THAP-type domain-containing protein n=1 Tax=Caerostris extrusa TaxID=172846 RepID=A0AAV4TW55_CAEEX|nr:hypothetical protein CEXT_699481 [Caerostris extrusa]